MWHKGPVSTTSACQRSICSRSRYHASHPVVNGTMIDATRGGPPELHWLVRARPATRSRQPLHAYLTECVEGAAQHA